MVLYLEILKSDMAFDFDIAFSKDGKLYEEYTYHLYKRDKTNRDQPLMPLMSSILLPQIVLPMEIKKMML